MALLDDAINACGGLARWNSLNRFTLHLSVGGTLFSDAGHAREFKDVTAESGIICRGQNYRGAVFADVNGDGWLDLLIATTGSGVPPMRSGRSC